MRQTSMFLFVAFIVLLLEAGIGHAQPSGGPYGPIPQKYELPATGSVFFVAPGGRPEGTRPATHWEALDHGYWRIRWNRLFPAAPADWWRAERHVAETPLHRFNYDMVFLDNQRLQSVGKRQDLTENSYYIDYENGFVYLSTDPTGREVEITAHDSALVRTMRRVHGRDNDQQGPTLRGITFTRYARLALLVEGVEPGEPMDPAHFGNEIVDTTLENLTISHCSRVAGYFRGNGLTIRHCAVSDTGTEGLYVINSSDVLLERNSVTRTNSRPRHVGYYASAIKIFNQSNRVVVRDNLIIDNPHASGIWYDVGNVYVSRTANQPFVRWTESPDPQTEHPVRTLDRAPVNEGEFERRGASFLEYQGPVVRSAQLKRFELLPEFPGSATGVELPVEVREALGWTESERPFPGAYPAGISNITRSE